MLAQDMDDFDLQPAGDIDLPPGRRRGTARREPGHLDSLACYAGGLASRVYLRLRHRLRVEGRGNLPAEPPFVMVANHGSLLDTPVLCSILPMRLHTRTYPLAAGDFFFDAPAKAVAATVLANALPVRRTAGDRQALDGLRRRLIREPCVYVIYPEGTRDGGAAVTRFKAGVGLLVAGSPVPVVPCWIRGAAEALPKGARLPQAGQITVRIGPPIRFDQAPNTRAGWQSAADTLYQAVHALAGANES